MKPAISVAGLRKSFGDHVVLDDLDLVVPEGSVFALLGPNGAGKTTTVDILATLTPASAGVSVARMSTVVVLPAPFGPRRAKTEPSGTTRSRSSRTMWSPKDFRSPATEMAGVMPVG